MKKIYKIVVWLLLLCTLISIGGVAAYAYSTARHPENKRVVDKANLLSDDVEEKLDARIEELSEKYKMDILIVYVNEPVSPKGVVDDADMFFEGNGYGYGSTQDGIEFYVNLYARDVVISTMGKGEDVFTDYGTDFILAKITPHLSKSNYNDAADTYLDYVEAFLKQAEKGRPYDYNNPYRTTWDYIKRIGIFTIIFFLIGLMIAAVRQDSLVSEMNTINKAYEAAKYESGISIPVTDRAGDNFIRSYVSRTRIESSSSGGGGSRSSSHGHYSSGGGHHGGSHGKF